MRTVTIALLIFMLILPCALQAQQINLQGSNEMKWADGEETQGDVTSSKRYFEDRLNMDMFYDNIRFGARFTMLQPSEFGETRLGNETLEKRFLEYRNDDRTFYLRAGDFYTTWGRGLTLNLIEDIDLGFDSGLDGLLVGSNWRFLKAEALSGRSTSNYLGAVREAQISGANVEADLPLNIDLGVNAMLLTPAGTNTYEENRTYGAYADWQGDWVSVYVEHAQEYVTLPTGHANEDDDNRGSYMSVSAYKGQFGIILDYKNYQYHKYGSGQGSNSPYAPTADALAFHSPPAVQREFTSNLMSKHPHIVKYNDEVGGQVELTWSPDFATISLSTALSSSHEDEDSWMPVLKEENSPYRETFIEVSAYPTMGSYLLAWAGYNEDLIFSKTISTSSRVSWTKRMVLGGEYETDLPFGGITGIVSAEGMNVTEILNDDSEVDHMEARFELGAIYMANYTIIGALEWSEEPDDLDGKDTWVSITGRAVIAENHELLVTVGRERGGLVCSSGKCRTVTPFSGVKIGLVSIF